MEYGNLLLIIISAYVVANVILYFMQERFLFKPEKLPEDFEFKYPNLNFEEYNLEKEPGVNINGIHFKINEPKGVVIYLKGNSKSLKGWGKFAVDFTRLGYDVLMVDYRGFGKSTGRRSEESIKEDLQYVYDRVREQVDEKYIIIYGRSLGSGFAAKIASINHPRMLVLESPYYSLAKVTKRYIPFMVVTLFIKFPIRTYKWLKYVDCPIKILHGTNDQLIPFNTAVSLSKVSPENTRLYSVIGAGHNNLHTFEEYHRMLAEIMDSKLPETIDPQKSSLNFKRKRGKKINI
jgi:pimeloyl-ACP methyl ester carboxylesterase